MRPTFPDKHEVKSMSFTTITEEGSRRKPVGIQSIITSVKAKADSQTAVLHSLKFIKVCGS